MSEFRLSFPARFLAGKSRLSAEDLSTLRRVSFPEGIRTSDDAALLLAIHHSCPEKSDEWDGFFIEGLADFIVNQTHPQGSLDDINVAWLIQVLSSDGVIHAPAEFEVLMQVIELSLVVPPALSAFAFDQLRHALTTRTGAYRHMRNVDSGTVTRHDVDFLLYILRRSINASTMVLSPIEIEALRRIDQATASRMNDPGWAELRESFRPAEGTQDDAPAIRWLRVPDSIFTEVGAAA